MNFLKLCSKFLQIYVKILKTQKKTLSRCSSLHKHSTNSKFKLPIRFEDKKNIWVEFGALNTEYKPINLGQGFPDFFPPKNVTEAFAKVAQTDNALLYQYTRSQGHLRLVNALAKYYSSVVNREINPLNEVVVTSGAYEALLSSILGNVEMGEEVIILEPAFDCYEPMLRLAFACTKIVVLCPDSSCEKVPSADSWTFDKETLENAFSKNTKAIIVNNPHNPLGKVFSNDELAFIALLCKKHDILCISDEVYEHMVYEPRKHIRMCTLPGMWERTLTIGTAGKCFSTTGWKIGWAYGPEHLIRHVQIAHQCITNACPTPLQESIAIALEKEIEGINNPNSYFNSFKRELEEKRNYFVPTIVDLGIKPYNPSGGYFVIADWTPLESKIDLKEETDQYKDFKFSKWLMKKVGVSVIPMGAFYSGDYKFLAEPYVRFCFCKEEKKLKDATQKFQEWKDKN